MLSDMQRRTAEAIVNIFETGSVDGDYGNVSLLPGDPGHLTYGRSQTTLASGNLYLLLKAYADWPGAACADALRPYLPRLLVRDLSLDHDAGLIRTLRTAGNDPAMWQAQDAFFDRIYWAPALEAAGRLGIASALGCAVVYDGIVHGSFALLRDRAVAQVGQGADEHAFVAAYLALRRAWLENNANPVLRRTVFRVQALQRLVATGNWDLALPVTVRGVSIDAEVLAGPPARISAQVVEERTLLLASPQIQGADVAALQRSLGVPPDGVFGVETDRLLREYQSAHGMVVDGIAGPATRAALGLT